MATLIEDALLLAAGLAWGWPHAWAVCWQQRLTPRHGAAGFLIFYNSARLTASQESETRFWMPKPELDELGTEMVRDQQVRLSLTIRTAGTCQRVACVTPAIASGRCDVSFVVMGIDALCIDALIDAHHPNPNPNPLYSPRDTPGLKPLRAACRYTPAPQP